MNLANELKVVEALRRRAQQEELSVQKPKKAPSAAAAKPVEEEQLLTPQSLQIIDELLARGHPLPEKITNASLANEAQIVKRLVNNGHKNTSTQPKQPPQQQ